MLTLRRLILSAFMLALVVSGSIASAVQTRSTLTDEQIRQQVVHRLSDKEIAGVNVSVARGIVTLSGAVDSLWAKNEAVAQARKTHDVSSVVSKITIAQAESDQAIAERIADGIRRYVFFTIFDDASAVVNQGVVTLMGRVTMSYKADAFEDLASRTTGVQEIKNQVQTLPASLNDDQLRYVIARQIYGDPLFWGYAIQVNPPIHIIVEHSRVTLTGVVVSEVERRTAEMIARSVFGVMNVENELSLERGTE